jgi:hypothetical protein
MGKIYAGRADGLGTRLLTILYARILAELLGFDFKVVWPELGAPFFQCYEVLHPGLKHEIFAGEHVFSGGGSLRGDFVDLCSLKDLSLLKLTGETKELAGLDKDGFKRLAEGCGGVLYKHPSPLLKFMQHELNLNAKVKCHWRSIEWSRELLTLCDDLCDKYCVEDSIAVHVRRGDVARMLVESDMAYLSRPGMMAVIFHRYTATKTFLSEVDKARHGEKIIICSEDQGVKKRFAEKYGDENVYLSCDSFSGSENQKAFIDLMLLSKSKILIAPVLSYFSKCAAAVGHCQYKPVPWDLPSLVEELAEIVDTNGARNRQEVKALIYASAAKMSDSALRPQLLNAAKSFDLTTAEAALASP